MNVQFQKISIPTPRTVIGNSRVGGGLKRNFWRGGGWGIQTKKPSVGECGTMQYILLSMLIFLTGIPWWQCA